MRHVYWPAFQPVASIEAPRCQMKQITVNCIRVSNWRTLRVCRFATPVLKRALVNRIGWQFVLSDATGWCSGIVLQYSAQVSYISQIFVFVYLNQFVTRVLSRAPRNCINRRFTLEDALVVCSGNVHPQVQMCRKSDQRYVLVDLSHILTRTLANHIERGIASDSSSERCSMTVPRARAGVQELTYWHTSAGVTHERTARISQFREAAP